MTCILDTDLVVSYEVHRRFRQTRGLWVVEQAGLDHSSAANCMARLRREEPAEAYRIVSVDRKVVG